MYMLDLYGLFFVKEHLQAGVVLEGSNTSPVSKCECI